MFNKSFYISGIPAMSMFFALHATAAPAGNSFFDAAVCKPPLTSKSSTSFYDAAEKLAKHELVGVWAIYKLPNPIGSADGLKSQELVFSNNSMGVMLEGLQAEEVATRLKLKPERPSALRAAVTKGFSRALPAAEQPSSDSGIVSVVVRESKIFPGKTMLMCEMLTHSEIQALKSF